MKCHVVLFQTKGYPDKICNKIGEDAVYLHFDDEWRQTEFAIFLLNFRTNIYVLLLCARCLMLCSESFTLLGSSSNYCIRAE